jgi:hypothetical protein
MESKKVKREVICADSHQWLLTQKDIKAIITSLPDMEETNHSLEEWEQWVRETCSLLAASLSQDGIIIFYQTDRKHKGFNIEKKTLISQEFKLMGYDNIFNKIVLKQQPETVNLFRPGFSNMFGFSKAAKSGKATPDVLYAGEMVYKNAMGFKAGKLAIDFISSQGDTDTIVDPFCGQGSILKLANDNGYNAVGVDIVQEQCNKALKLR